MATEYSWSFKAGDKTSRTFIFWDDTDHTVPSDLSSFTYTAQARRSKSYSTSDPDAAFTVLKSSNEVTVSLTSTQTRALQNLGRRFYWDMQQLDGSGEPETIFEGVLTVQDDVTR